MADSFDIVDIVFNAVKKAGTGFILYKNKSKTGEKQNHIIVSTPPVDRKTYVNKSPFMNVNVFVKNFDDGMTDHQTMKDTVRVLEKALSKIESPEGMYFKSRIVWSQPMGEAKEGFDCKNIRLEVITQLN